MKKINVIIVLLFLVIFIGCKKTQPVNSIKTEEHPYDLQVYKLIYHARKTIGEITSEGGMNTREKFGALQILIATQVKAGLIDDAFHLARSTKSLVDKAVFLTIIGNEQRKRGDAEAAFKTVEEAADTFPGWSAAADTTTAYNNILELYGYLGKVDEAIVFMKKYRVDEWNRRIGVCGCFKSILKFAEEQKNKNAGRAKIIEAMNKNLFSVAGVKPALVSDATGAVDVAVYYKEIAISMSKLGFHDDAKKIFDNQNLCKNAPDEFIVGAIDAGLWEEAETLASKIVDNNPSRYVWALKILDNPKYVDQREKILKALNPIIEFMIKASNDDDAKNRGYYYYTDVLVGIGYGDKVLDLIPSVINKQPHIIRRQIKQMVDDGKTDRAKSFLDDCLKQPDLNRYALMMIAEGFVTLGEKEKAKNILEAFIPTISETSSDSSEMLDWQDRNFIVELVALLAKCGMTDAVNSLDAKYPDLRLRFVLIREKAFEQTQAGNYEAAFQTYKSITPDSRYVPNAQVLIDYLVEKKEYELAIKYFIMSDPDYELYDDKLAKIVHWQIQLSERDPKKYPLSEAIKIAEMLPIGSTKVYYYCRLAELYMNQNTL